jgi:uracil-DNA glycosylase family 4
VATLVELEREALPCTRCALAAGRTHTVFGVGDPHADLMFVGEGPGQQEDLKGEPFVGRSGQLLDRLMQEEIGIGRDRCYIANVVKCRPPGNRDPLPEEIAACRPYLEQQIELIDPAVIITLGNFASKLLLDTAAGITKLRGHVYPYPVDPKRAVVPTFHPSAALRSGGSGATTAQMRADFVRAKEALAAGAQAR